MQRKKAAAFLVSMMLSVSLVPAAPLVQNTAAVEAAAKIKLNAANLILRAGWKYRLKVTGTDREITWSSSNKKTATVNQNGTVTAKKAGKAVITAAVKKKKLKCRITVKKQYEDNVRAGYDKLYQAVMGGEIQLDDGSPVLADQIKDMTYYITYDAKEDNFQFAYLESPDDSPILEMDLDGSTTGEVYYFVIDKNDEMKGYAQAVLDLETFKPDTKLDFQGDLTGIQDQANRLLHSAMEFWQFNMEYDAGVSFRELGFLRY